MTTLYSTEHKVTCNARNARKQMKICFFPEFINMLITNNP